MSASHSSFYFVKFMLLEMEDRFLCLDRVRRIPFNMSWCFGLDQASLVTCLTQLRAYKH